MIFSNVPYSSAMVFISRANNVYHPLRRKDFENLKFEVLVLAVQNDHIKLNSFEFYADEKNVRPYFLMFQGPNELKISSCSPRVIYFTFL